MRKRTILSFAMLTSAFYVQAQDVEQANKATDAEQYEKAKGILKSIIQSKPTNGKATFLLGNVYLKQNIADPTIKAIVKEIVLQGYITAFARQPEAKDMLKNILDDMI